MELAHNLNNQEADMLYPAPHILRKIEKIDYLARIGWNPIDKCFALIEIWKKREREAKNSIIGCDFPLDWKVFGSKWDWLSEMPIYITDITIDEMMTGRVIELLKRWTSPLKKRIREDQKEARDQYNYAMDQVGDEMGEDIFARAKKEIWPDITSPYDITPEDEYILSGQAEEEAKAEEVFTPAGDVENDYRKPMS